MPQSPFDPYEKTTPLRSHTLPLHMSSMPWWVIPVIAVFLALCILGLLFTYLLVSVVSGAGSTPITHTGTPLGNRVSIPTFGGKQPRSASAVADDFMQGLKDQDYLRAYDDFDATVLVLESPLDFEHQVKHTDTCYGGIVHFQVVVHTESQEESHITYRVIRKKFAGSYCFQLVLLQSDIGSWAITSYGKNDTPGPSGVQACA